MNIKSIKNYLKLKVGSNVIVIYYGSRNKKEKYYGIVDRIYENIFTIKLTNGDIKSFSYIDILTKTVQISI